MKLLTVVHDYLPLHLGGSEVHAHQATAEMARRGHEVASLFTERDLSAPEGDVRTGELDGVRTIEVVHQREYGDLRETFEQRFAQESFRAVVAGERPDLVHFHHLSVWGTGCLAVARELGAKVVVTMHDYHPLCDNAVLLRDDGELCTAGPKGECVECLRRHPLRAERWPETGGLDGDALLAHAARTRFEKHRADLALADRVVCPSRFLADVFVEAGVLREEQVVVMKAGYPGELRDPRRSDPAEPLRVGYVGGHYRSKGVHVLVEAFRHLEGVAARLDTHGVLEWFPDYVAELEELARGLPVALHGPYDPADVDRVLAGFDVLCVPSIWYENMPITIQEAYRNGLPVIATDLGGMREAVEDGVSGLTFPRGDAAALAGCIRRLAEDRELLLRLAGGRPHVPTLEEIVDGLEALYAAC